MMPKLLSKGDAIAVYCGSRQIHEKDTEYYESARKFLKSEKLELIEDENLYSNASNEFYNAKDRAKFFNKQIKNKNIKAMFSCKGGADVISLLDFLDYDAIGDNPKIICGYSDLSILVNYINFKTDLITFWGPNFTLLGKPEANFCRMDFKSKFLSGNKDLGRDTDEYRTIRSGKCCGKIIGGTISSISFLVCGKYKIDFNNKILILEDYGTKCEPLKIKSYLSYMKQNGVFNNLKGIWVGNYKNNYDYNLEDEILELTKDKDYPIIKSNNFGHIYENMIIPIGANAQIDTSRKVPIFLKGED